MSPMQQGATRKKQLTSRQKEIIQILTKSTASHPVTVSMISEMMGLSSRTILREIPHIKDWMEQNDFHFVRKPGVGLILDESVENQKLILELLEVENIQKEYSKEERRRCILADLLYAEEPLKSYYFTSKFRISEGTLTKDLDEAAEWLHNYDIQLIRRPGLGILIEGDEGRRRQAIANIVYESMDENQIMQLLHGEPQQQALSAKVHSQVFSLLDADMTEQIEKILLDAGERLHIHYTDSAFVGLIIHIGLAIKRIRNNERIEMEPDRLQKLMMAPEFSVAEEICDQLKEAFHIRIPRGEIGYITAHLSSARIWSNAERVNQNIESINLRQLIKEMIAQVEQRIGITLHDDEQLMEDLCNHMAPAISRLSMGVRIENPQLESIREEYPEIMQATKDASHILCQATGLDEIPDAEISFLAMHFGAAMEKKLQQMKTISVMVVCPTGVGTSRILEASLKKNFSCIHVHGTISAFHIDTEQLKQQGIDLIISTVTLTTDFPWICVSPILQAQDRRQIESMLIAMQDKRREHPAPRSRQPLALDEIQQITRYGAELLDLVTHVKFDCFRAAKNRSEIIARAGALFATDDRMAADIETGLYERDRLSDTYIRQFHALMLHCRTSMVDHARFGYIKLEPPVYEKARVIFGALVMLAPEDQGDSIPHQLVGAVSALLVEDKTLLDQLHAGNWNGSRVSIENGLGAYYKQIVEKKIGVG